MKLFRIPSIAAAMLLSSMALSPAQLVGWNTAGNDSTTPPLANDYAILYESHINVGDWTLSSNTPPMVLGLTDLYGTRGYTNVTSLDTTKLYTSFTLSADPGYELSLTGITFSSSISGSASGAPKKGAWGYRIDNGSGFNEWTTFTFDLPQSLILSTGSLLAWNFDTPITTPGIVEFGFWAWGGTTNRSVAVISIVDSGLTDGFSVNGSVNAVPEPSTAGLLISVAAIAIIFFRKKQRRLTPSLN